MLSTIRTSFNQNFTTQKYQSLVHSIGQQFNIAPKFRIAETPVFIPDSLKTKLVTACEEITDVICHPDFKKLSQNAIPKEQSVPNETPHTTFLQMDFGICKDKNGELTPQLIEAQGFPSLYFFQHIIAEAYKQHYDIPNEYTHLRGLNGIEYIELLRRIILGNSKPENVVLLEVEPEKQTTAIDFIIAKHLIGIDYVCISDLKKSGDDVYYINSKGKKTQVERIFNRVIFDELIKREDLKREFYLTQPANIEWVGHPNWFFKISKHTLPLLKSQYVPESFYLNEVDKIPTDLENYVLKPLYSFAGTGVIININKYDIDAIKDKENYILQRKVDYAPIVPTPSEPAKCEIRMLMLWEDGHPRPIIVNNLARLSKGEMVGVRYNKNKDWVGGSVGFFRRN